MNFYIGVSPKHKRSGSNYFYFSFFCNFGNCSTHCNYSTKSSIYTNYKCFLLWCIAFCDVFSFLLFLFHFSCLRNINGFLFILMIIDFSKYKLEILLFILFFYSLIFCNLSKSRVLFIESNDEANWYFTWLPWSYKAVEYIKNTWTQYLLLWLQIKDWYRIEWKFNFQQKETIPWGAITGWYLWNSWWIDYRLYVWWIKWNNNWFSYWYLWSFTEWGTATWKSLNVDYEIVYSWVSWNNFFNINWTRVATNTNSYSTNLLWECPLFADWNSHSYDVHPWMKCYYAKYYNSQWELVRYLIPCYRKSDSVIWMFDIVNKVFYTNSWSWTFEKWWDV